MLERRRFLIALADGEHARFVHVHPGQPPRTVVIEDSVAAHKRSANLGADRPGASFHSHSVAHHSLSPRHDRKAQAKEHFADLVASQLNAADANGMFDALLLVAPARTLEALRKGLDHATAARLVAAIQKDLMKVPDYELASHLSRWVRPRKRTLPYAATSKQ